MKQSKTIKNMICCAIGIVIVILLGNTNNNPTSFLLRLFPPSTDGGSSFYYANLVVLIVIFILITELQRINEWKLLDNYWIRLACLFIFVFFCNIFNEGMIKVYKSFQEGLSAIYLNHDQMNLTFYGESKVANDSNYEVYNGQGYITLKNCANKTTTPFKIKILTDKEMQFKGNKMMNSNQEYTLASKEERRIELDFRDEFKIPSSNSPSGRSSISSGFKIILYNEKEECIFKP